MDGSVGLLRTFVELPPFRRDSRPFVRGVEIPGTGGCGKMRWAVRGKGKRGGARVIYFLRLVAGELVLVAAYGKGERDDVPRTWLKRVKEAYDHEQGKTSH